jgi:hypothetical protein
MGHTQNDLDEEAARATEMEFQDGTRVVVDRSETGVEVSIT